MVTHDFYHRQPICQAQPTNISRISQLREPSRRRHIDRKLFGAAVGKLSEFLDYKLPFAGLPAPLRVGGVSPRECYRCGKESREKTVRAEGRISCPLCGLEMDVHENNARLVAAQVPGIVARIAAARRKRESGEGKGENGEGKGENGEGKGENGEGKGEDGGGKWRGENG